MSNSFWDTDENTVVNANSAAANTQKSTPAVSTPQTGSTDETHHPDSTRRADDIPLPSHDSHYTADRQPPPPPVGDERSSAARERLRRRKVSGRKNRGGEWAWVIIAVALLAVVIVMSMGLTLFFRSTIGEQPEVIPTAALVLPTPVDARSDFSDLTVGSGLAGEQVTLADGRDIILEPWNGTSRFTVLLMGLDRRPGENGLTYRTDSMMLVSIDPETDQIGILSIPRDLYVEVPGYGQLQRVNTPMVLGELQQPGYGPQLAMQTVQYNLGIRVHDYVVVDFNGVISIIDLLGGIEVDVPYRISDPQYPNMYYGYDPFYLEPGLQLLDGATALKFARTRHGDSDFRRAERQQMVLYAVRDRILDVNMLPELIIQAPNLLSQLSDNVYTGMTIDQIIQLALYVTEVPEANIQTGVISPEYVMGYTTGGGASVLVPNRGRLGTLMVEVFGENYSQ